MINEIRDAVNYEPNLTVKELWNRIQKKSESISIKKVSEKWNIPIHPDTPLHIVLAYTQARQIIENVNVNSSTIE